MSTTFTVSEVGSPNIFQYYQSKGLIPNGSDLFEGGYVIFDPGTTDVMTQITSFDITGIAGSRIATFIIDRDLSSNSFGIGTSLRINPGPCQIISNETIAPTENSNRFFGFINNGGSNEIGYNNIKERNDIMQDYDVFYLWIKRTLINNTKASLDTGALILIEFDDWHRQNS